MFLLISKINSTVQFLYNAVFGVHTDEPSYIGTILQRNFIVIFPIIFFVKFEGEKHGSQVCYKGIALYN